MGFLYRVVWVLKALWICLSETINFLRKLIKLTFSGCPPKFYHRVMYTAPSSGHISLNFNMTFKLILRRFEVVFWSENAALFERLMEIQSQIHQYYTMALKLGWPFCKPKIWKCQNTVVHYEKYNLRTSTEVSDVESYFLKNMALLRF